MVSRIRRAMAFVISVAMLAVPLGGQASAGGGPVNLRADLSGANEVPGPGDPDGWGKANIWVNAAAGAVCFKLAWYGIEGPVAAHIHRGRAGVAGPVRVLLFESSTPLPSTIHAVGGCVEAAHDLLMRIVDQPNKFYVNVHNVPYPAGAIRGQLHRAY